MGLFDSTTTSKTTWSAGKFLRPEDEELARKNVGAMLAGQGSAGLQAQIREGDEALARQSANQRAQAHFQAARGGFLGQGAAVQNQALTEDAISKNLAAKLRSDSQLRSDEQMSATQTALSQYNQETANAKNEKLAWWAAGAEAAEFNPVVAAQRDKMWMDTMGLQMSEADKALLSKYTDEIVQSNLRRAIEANAAKVAEATTKPDEAPVQWNPLTLEKATPEQIAEWTKSPMALKALTDSGALRPISNQTYFGRPKQTRVGEFVQWGDNIYKILDNDVSWAERVAMHPGLDQLYMIRRMTPYGGSKVFNYTTGQEEYLWGN